MAPRIHSEEFKRNAVDMVLGGQPINDVAAQLDMPRGTLWGWVESARTVLPPKLPQQPLGTPRGFVSEATYQAALDEIAKLKQENKMLGEATRYFARRSGPL